MSTDVRSPEQQLVDEANATQTARALALVLKAQPHHPSYQCGSVVKCLFEMHPSNDPAVVREAQRGTRLSGNGAHGKSSSSRATTGTSSKHNRTSSSGAQPEAEEAKKKLREQSGGVAGSSSVNPSSAAATGTTHAQQQFAKGKGEYLAPDSDTVTCGPQEVEGRPGNRGRRDSVSSVPGGSAPSIEGSGRQSSGRGDGTGLSLLSASALGSTRGGTEGGRHHIRAGSRSYEDELGTPAATPLSSSDSGAHMGPSIALHSLKMQLYGQCTVDISRLSLPASSSSPTTRGDAFGAIAAGGRGSTSPAPSNPSTATATPTNREGSLGGDGEDSPLGKTPTNNNSSSTTTTLHVDPQIFPPEPESATPTMAGDPSQRHLSHLTVHTFYQSPVVDFEVEEGSLLPLGQNARGAMSTMIPSHAPPTHKGLVLRFGYVIHISCVWSPRLAPTYYSSTRGLVGGEETRRVTVIKVPVKVYSPMAVFRPLRGILGSGRMLAAPIYERAAGLFHPPQCIPAISPPLSDQLVTTVRGHQSLLKIPVSSEASSSSRAAFPPSSPSCNSCSNAAVSATGSSWRPPSPASPAFGPPLASPIMTTAAVMGRRYTAEAVKANMDQLSAPLSILIRVKQNVPVLNLFLMSPLASLGDTLRGSFSCPSSVMSVDGSGEESGGSGASGGRGSTGTPAGRGAGGEPSATSPTSSSYVCVRVKMTTQYYEFVPKELLHPSVVKSYERSSAGSGGGGGAAPNTTASSSSFSSSSTAMPSFASISAGNFNPGLSPFPNENSVATHSKVVDEQEFFVGNAIETPLKLSISSAKYMQSFQTDLLSLQWTVKFTFFCCPLSDWLSFQRSGKAQTLKFPSDCQPELEIPLVIAPPSPVLGVADGAYAQEESADSHDASWHLGGSATVVQS